tara:strand:+ start:1524 stop:1829 length:306 start_codon:yes stop_codon:yes gene_type:complete
LNTENNKQGSEKMNENNDMKTTQRTMNDKHEGREALRQYLSSAKFDLRMKPHFETYVDLLAEVKRLRKELSEAEDVIQIALDHTKNDDDRRLFEDFLEVVA